MNIRSERERLVFLYGYEKGQDDFRKLISNLEESDYNSQHITLDDFKKYADENNYAILKTEIYSEYIKKSEALQRIRTEIEELEVFYDIGSEIHEPMIRADDVTSILDEYVEPISYSMDLSDIDSSMI